MAGLGLGLGSDQTPSKQFLSFDTLLNIRNCRIIFYICDHLCINHPFTAFNQISFFMSFSSPIYADYNGIFLLFIRVTLQNLWVPVRNRSKIFHFEKSEVFRTLQLLRTTLHKSCRRINVRCESNAGRSGNLRSGLTRDYSKKFSSMETTRFDEENQAFLTADCSRL